MDQGPLMDESINLHTKIIRALPLDKSDCLTWLLDDISSCADLGTPQHTQSCTCAWWWWSTPCRTRCDTPSATQLTLIENI